MERTAADSLYDWISASVSSVVGVDEEGFAATPPTCDNAKTAAMMMMMLIVGLTISKEISIEEKSIEEKIKKETRLKD